MIRYLLIIFLFSNLFYGCVKRNVITPEKNLNKNLNIDKKELNNIEKEKYKNKE